MHEAHRVSPARARPVRHRFLSRRGALALTIVSILASLAIPPTTLANPTTITGIVYRDYDASGTKDGLPQRNEPGVAGIRVSAFGPADAPIASAVTGPDGSYLLTVPVAAGTEVRVEFDVPTEGFQSGPFGAGGSSTTTVTFVRTPAAGVNLGINRPGQYCQQNALTLDLATSCYIFGNQAGVTNPVLIDVPYTGGAPYVVGRPGDDYNQPGLGVHDLMVPASAIGTTWGIAYQRSSRTLFAAPFMKRHAGLGPGGTGTIYRIDASAPDGAAAPFLDLNSLFGPGTAGIDPRPSGADVNYFLRDPDTWDLVGKVALGDLDMYEDDQTLYTVNLADRQLYQIPIGSPPVAPSAADIGRFPIPNPCSVADDMRPFGLGVYDGLVYVGLVCTAESTFGAPGFPDGDPSQLSAHIYSFNPFASTFAPAMSFALDYSLGCTDIDSATGACNIPSIWLPWRPTFGAATFKPGSFGSVVGAHPQPWLTGIDFDNGDMIIGLRDRFGDQIGSYAYAPTGNMTLYVGLTSGDILRACRDASGGWVLESGAGCGQITTRGVGDFTPMAHGPGGREYYFDDGHVYQDEIAGGGLVQVPGYPEVASVVTDPRPDVRTAPPPDLAIYDGGIRFFDNVTSNADAGRLTRLYRVYDEPFAPPQIPPVVGTFGKSNGLGDLEVLCDAAPIEIGNRVWYDIDANGRQDPGEEPVAGVTMRLYQRDAAGGLTLVGTTLTGPDGEYYFNATNVPGGVLPNTDYEIRIDNQADFTSGPLLGWTSTRANAQEIMRDSNGLTSGTYVYTTLRTGPAGYNNHTYDFGFVRPTAIDLVSFTATPVAGGTQLRWETGAERGTWGFHILRSLDGARESAVRVTDQLIPARGQGVYAWLDASAPPGATYWLQEIELSGAVHEYGPARTAAPADDRRRIYLPGVAVP